MPLYMITEEGKNWIANINVILSRNQQVCHGVVEDTCLWQLVSTRPIMKFASSGKKERLHVLSIADFLISQHTRSQLSAETSRENISTSISKTLTPL